MVQHVDHVCVRSGRIVNAADAQCDLKGFTELGQASIHATEIESRQSERVEGVALDLRRSNRPRDRDRLLARRSGLDRDHFDGQDLSQTRGDSGAGQGWRLGGHKANCLAAGIEGRDSVASVPCIATQLRHEEPQPGTVHGPFCETDGFTDEPDRPLGR